MFLPSKPKTRVNTELVNELLNISSTTDGGATASSEQKQQIAQLVEQLRQAGGVKDPVDSDLLYGEYEVTYASKPLASGGPILRSPPGRALFKQQILRQIVNPDNTLLNAVNFRAFGLFPGNALQDAFLQKLSPDTYKLILQPAKLFGIQFGRSRDIERFFNMIYLDEAVRVVEFVPDNASKSSSDQTVLFVLRRLNSSSHNSTSNQKQSSQWGDALGTLQQRIDSLTQGQQSRPGLATQAERKYRQQNARSGR